MILVEIVTSSNKVITFADNGVLAIKKNPEIVFGKLDKDRALNLAATITQWANQQPSLPEIKVRTISPYYDASPPKHYYEKAIKTGKESP